jgi:hypothetical protein
MGFPFKLLCYKEIGIAYIIDIAYIIGRAYIIELHFVPFANDCVDNDHRL